MLQGPSQGTNQFILLNQGLLYGIITKAWNTVILQEEHSRSKGLSVRQIAFTSDSSLHPLSFMLNMVF
jgi:hypothetical protein